LTAGTPIAYHAERPVAIWATNPIGFLWATNHSIRFGDRQRCDGGFFRHSARLFLVLHFFSVIDRVMRTFSVGQGSCWVRVAPFPPAASC